MSPVYGFVYHAFTVESMIEEYERRRIDVCLRKMVMAERYGHGEAGTMRVGGVFGCERLKRNASAVEDDEFFSERETDAGAFVAAPDGLLPLSQST